MATRQIQNDHDFMGRGRVTGMKDPQGDSDGATAGWVHGQIAALTLGDGLPNDQTELADDSGERV